MKKAFIYLAVITMFATILTSCNKQDEELFETPVVKKEVSPTVVGIKKDEIEEPVVL